MNITKAALAFTAILSLAPYSRAQNEPPTSDRKFDKSVDCRTLSPRTSAEDCAHKNTEIKIFRLINVTQQHDANEILVAARNIADPSTKMFLIANQNAIVTYTYPAETARIAEIVRELDRPRKAFRVTYTFTDPDTGLKLLPMASTIVSANESTELKRGDKIPVITGEITKDTAQGGAQYTYLDVGLNIQTTIGDQTGGGYITYKIEQSTVAETPSKIGPNEPIVNQTTLQGGAPLKFNKSETLGTIELPGSRHHVIIAAQLEELQ